MKRLSSVEDLLNFRKKWESYKKMLPSWLGRQHEMQKVYLCGLLLQLPACVKNSRLKSQPPVQATFEPH